MSKMGSSPFSYTATYYAYSCSVDLDECPWSPHEDTVFARIILLADTVFARINILAGWREGTVVGIKRCVTQVPQFDRIN